MHRTIFVKPMYTESFGEPQFRAIYDQEQHQRIERSKQSAFPDYLQRLYSTFLLTNTFPHDHIFPGNWAGYKRISFEEISRHLGKTKFKDSLIHSYYDYDVVYHDNNGQEALSVLTSWERRESTLDRMLQGYAAEYSKKLLAEQKSKTESSSISQKETEFTLVSYRALKRQQQKNYCGSGLILALDKNYQVIHKVAFPEPFNLEIYCADIFSEDNPPWSDWSNYLYNRNYKAPQDAYVWLYLPPQLPKLQGEDTVIVLEELFKRG